MSKTASTAAPAREQTFEEWVESQRDELERHARSDYQSADVARAFLDYVDSEGSP